MIAKMRISKWMLTLAAFIMLAVVLMKPFAASAHTLDNDCERCQNSPVKTTKQLKDHTIKNRIMKFVRTEHKAGNSIYKKSDFKWDQAVRDYYGEGISTIFVPFKSNPKSDTEKGYLTVAYNANNGDYGHFTIMQITRKTAKSKEFTMSVATMDGHKVVGMKYDKNGKGTTVFYAQPNLTVQPMGYWQRVQDCIQNSWKTMPSWARWLCSSACGACLGCLGGYTIGCGLSQI